MMHNIEKLVSPRCIALIGASNHPEKIGYQILDNLRKGGFASKIYPINLKEDKILDLTAYKDVMSVPEPIDLAIIAIPSTFVKEALLSCAEKRIPSVIVISAGFAEIGEDGAKLQQEISDIAKAKGIALLGPNCLGFVNTELRLNATFAKEMPNTGRVAFISQSGAVITSIIDWSKNSTVGFSKIFSIGNKALISETELLEYLYNDPKTDVIACYIERLEINEHLTNVLIKFAKKKPTIVLFGGKSVSGAKAALSHTGSVVTSYLSIKTYLSQAGVILADGLEDLLSYSRIFSNYKKISGKNIAIITNAGGPGIAAADKISELGLSLAELSLETVSSLKKNLRPEANTKNPVDVLGDANEAEYEKAISIVSKDKLIDGILLILTPQSSTKIDETANIIAKYKGEKPLVSSFVGGEILSNAKKIIEESGKPCFSYPEEASEALKVLVNFATVRPTLMLPKQSGKKIIKLENKDLELCAYGLPIVSYYQGEYFEEIQKQAEKIGFPVVLKTADQSGHKSDQGGVFVNIENTFELKRAFMKLGGPAIVGKMIKTKHEIMLGIKKEPHIGTTILFGTGGIYSEIYADFAYRIAPVSKESVLEMIQETKIGQILAGARGQHKYDLDCLASIILQAIEFTTNFQNISEVDFNPIIADENDFHMVDVRLILN